MSENVESLVPHLLMKIQQDIAAFRKSVEERFASMELRYDRLEAINRKRCRDFGGMLVMMRAAAGDFDEDVRDIEEWMEAFEKATN